MHDTHVYVYEYVSAHIRTQTDTYTHNGNYTNVNNTHATNHHTYTQVRICIPYLALMQASDIGFFFCRLVSPI